MSGAISRTPLRPGPALVALVLMGLSAAPAVGQASRGSGSVAVLDTQPLGQLATGPGVGLALAASWAVDPARTFRVRGDFRVAIYGYDEREVCLGGGVGCWIRVDVNTDYTFLYAGLGPEVAVPLPGFDLLLVGSAGLARFAVASSLEGVDEHDGSFGDTVHFQDNVFGWSTGGEARIPVSSRIAVSLGAHYHHNGTASYVPDGGVSENPDGTLDIRARTTDANLVALTLGIGIRL